MAGDAWFSMSGNPLNIAAKLQEADRTARKVGFAKVEEGAKSIEHLGQLAIKHFPANSEWRRSQSRAFPGRYETGAFASAFQVRNKGASDVLKLWDIGWRSPEDYFYYQENGFTHRSAGAIPGVHLMRDVRGEMEALLTQASRDMIKAFIAVAKGA